MTACSPHQDKTTVWPIRKSVEKTMVILCLGLSLSVGRTKRPRWNSDSRGLIHCVEPERIIKMMARRFGLSTISEKSTNSLTATALPNTDSGAPTAAN